MVVCSRAAGGIGKSSYFYVLVFDTRCVLVNWGRVLVEAVVVEY